MSKKFKWLEQEKKKNDEPHTNTKAKVLLSAHVIKTKSQTDSNWLTDTSELGLTLLRVYKWVEA